MAFPSQNAPGAPLEVTKDSGYIVVTERIGSLIEKLAPARGSGKLSRTSCAASQRDIGSGQGCYDMTLKTEGIEGPRIFRVIDWELFPLVTEEIKAALEKEGATGLECRLVPTSP